MVAAAHAFLQVRLVFLHFFLHSFFVLPLPMHSVLSPMHVSNSTSQSPLHFSKSIGLWHGGGDGGGDATATGAAGGGDAGGGGVGDDEGGGGGGDDADGGS